MQSFLRASSEGLEAVFDRLENLTRDSEVTGRLHEPAVWCKTQSFCPAHVRAASRRAIPQKDPTSYVKEERPLTAERSFVPAWFRCSSLTFAASFRSPSDYERRSKIMKSEHQIKT